jgi:hypothetical protein
MSLDQLLAEFRASSEKFSTGGSSSFRGVSWNKAGAKWVSSVKNKTTGKREQTHHATEEEAARAYDARARRIHGK